MKRCYLGGTPAPCRLSQDPPFFLSTVRSTTYRHNVMFSSVWTQVDGSYDEQSVLLIRSNESNGLRNKPFTFFTMNVMSDQLSQFPLDYTVSYYGLRIIR